MRIARGLVACLIWLVPALTLAQDFPRLEDVLAGAVGHAAQFLDFHVVMTPDGRPGPVLSVRCDGQTWRQELTRHRGDDHILLAGAVGQGRSLWSVYPAALRSFPVPPFLFWLLTDPMSWLRTSGTDVNRLSWQFHGDIGCLVIGAEAGDLDSPQLWLSAEDHFVVRTLSGRGTFKLDLRWLEYRRVGNMNLPHRCLIGLPDGQSVGFALDWLGVNSGLPAMLFHESVFRSSYLGGDLPALPPSLAAYFSQFPQATGGR